MVIGVFEGMRKDNNDLITSQKVVVTQSSIWNNRQDFNGECIVNNDANCFLCTQNDKNSYVIIQLVNHQISIQGIKLGSVNNDYAPLAWLLEGSNDNQFYEPIISVSEGLCEKFKNNEIYACDGQYNKTYNTPKTKEYEYFKISQIGMNNAIYSTREDVNNYIYSFRLSLVEFYLTKPILLNVSMKRTFYFSLYLLLFVLFI